MLTAGPVPPAADVLPLVRIRATRSAFDLELRALGGYWELLYFLVWRDLKVRYKQTFIGVGWAMLQPLLTMLIFTAVFSGLANVPSEGVPYPVFAFTGLLPWTYFSSALSRSGNSLVSNASLITKVYFPRLIIPVAAVLGPLVDFAVAFVLLLGLMMWFQIMPSVAIVTVPIFLLLSMLAAFAVSLWLSALCVRYRDVSAVIPFLLQIWLFASPVAYPASMVPEKWQLLYGLNPMVGVIEGFRWAVFNAEPPAFKMMATSAVAMMVILYGGLVYFKRMERVFADVV